ncbi:hypothetical protein ACFSGJ_12365 [Halodurantibacterium flavum]|uniref:Uncharacterized protein n=1 Tax=Halodurantibacterium flavum TaxID=1382802 RepID=A0ABW4S5Z6_9RHOB
MSSEVRMKEVLLTGTARGSLLTLLAGVSRTSRNGRTEGAFHF